MLFMVKFSNSKRLELVTSGKNVNKTDLDNVLVDAPRISNCGITSRGKGVFANFE